MEDEALTKLSLWQVQKKPLSERWHRCSCGVSAQRDFYSAYLACYKEVVEAILESGPTLGASAAVKVAGKLPKVVKAVKANKAAGQAAKAAKGTASYKFPGTKELAKRLGVTVKRFHRETKSHITKQLSDVLQRKGIKNPVYWHRLPREYCFEGCKNRKNNFYRCSAK